MAGNQRPLLTADQISHARIDRRDPSGDVHDVRIYVVAFPRPINRVSSYVSFKYSGVDYDIVIV